MAPNDQIHAHVRNTIKHFLDDAQKDDRRARKLTVTTSRWSAAHHRYFRLRFLKPQITIPNGGSEQFLPMLITDMFPRKPSVNLNTQLDYRGKLRNVLGIKSTEIT